MDTWRQFEREHLGCLDTESVIDFDPNMRVARFSSDHGKRPIVAILVVACSLFWVAAFAFVESLRELLLLQVLFVQLRAAHNKK